MEAPTIKRLAVAREASEQRVAPELAADDGPSQLMTVSGDATYGGKTTIWAGVAVGMLVIIAIVIGVSALATELSPPLRVADPAPTAKPTTSAQPAPPASPEAAPAALSPGQPAAIIGSWCTPGADWLTGDGSLAHCVPLQGTKTYLWSMNDDPIADPGPGTDPATMVCMAQTSRSAVACGPYLARQGYHGPDADAKPQ